jgi:hypothetical protein
VNVGCVACCCVGLGDLGPWTMAMIGSRSACCFV